MRKPKRRPIFDDQSRLLDRFGLLLVVTVASIVILSLVDIGPRANGASSRWETALASVLVGTTLIGRAVFLVIMRRAFRERMGTEVL